MSCLRTAAFIATSLVGVTGNNINTANTHAKSNLKKMICPFLSSAMEEGFLGVKSEYTKEELQLVILRGGVHAEDAAKIIMANFDHNPSGKQDIFNMEGAQNEHATSTGITDCFSTFSNCKEELGVPVCVSATANPNCDADHVAKFNEFVGAVDTNNDKFISIGELVAAEKNSQFPILDHNPHGLGSLYVSIFVTVKLYGQADGSGITVDDFRRVMIDRQFGQNSGTPALSSGYFWGRPIEPVIPEAATLLDGDDATCVPGTSVLGPDNCNTCRCPALGLRSLALSCTRKLCVTVGPTPGTFTTTPKPDENKFPWAGSALTCKPGKKIGHPDRCNACTCPSSGMFADATACTNKKARKCRRIKNTRCVPGLRFTKADGCTECVCPNNGRKARAKVCTSTCADDDYYYYHRRLEMLV
eukprot:TRINITY_DN17889_c0_g1_i9.p1 TRINITY_DN17889_c0_g1~~TRINITY_DN17889_c0_g1_i9.p1  ORF type:complete len:416 (+),score=76.58 TRINITY_DN17889_c0_g1_i9:84-1331(+)